MFSSAHHRLSPHLGVGGHVRYHSTFTALCKTLLQFIFIFGIAAIALLVFSSHAFAQTRTDPYANAENDVPRDPTSQYQISIIEFSSAVTCFMVGINPVNPQTPCLDINPETRKIGFSPPVDTKDMKIGGLMGLSSNMIATLYVQPISTQQQINYFASNFGIVKESHAQTQEEVGQGFVGLSAIQHLFIRVRDIVYLIMVLLFVIVGIAIMLRVRIDPRTVMTIQNQIPKLVIGLLLITFSFSIAGLLIDTMWSFTYFGINAITSDLQLCAKPNTPLETVATRNILDNPVAYMTNLIGDETGCFGRFDGVSGLALDVAKTFGDVLARITLTVFGLDEQLHDCADSWWIIPTHIDVGACLKNGFFGIVKYAVTLLAGFIVFFAMLAALFRIWFTLLRAYINIVIAIILAPLWIVLALLPGGGYGFMQWIRHMVAHLSAFPATVFMMLLATIFAADNPANRSIENVFLPPLIGNPNIADSMGTILGFSVLMLTPDMLHMIRDALKTPQGKYTGNIIKRARSNPLSAANSAASFGYQASMMQYIPIIGSKIPGLPQMMGPHHRQQSAQEGGTQHPT